MTTHAFIVFMFIVHVYIYMSSFIHLCSISSQINLCGLQLLTFFPYKPYVVGIHQNCLVEMILMSTHNIKFGKVSVTLHYLNLL